MTEEDDPHCIQSGADDDVICNVGLFLMSMILNDIYSMKMKDV